MAIILNIDTAVDTASVCLSDKTVVLGQAVNNNQKDHAGWLHSAIKDLLSEGEIDIKDMSAVAVSIGPGSYTGLRVGLSSAKGLCYALNIPLITIGTLEIMANAIDRTIADLFCPLIDARRMEVFTAVYDKELNERVKPCAMIIDSNSFSDILASNRVCFSGNGKKKLQNVINHHNAIFHSAVVDAADMALLSFKYFNENRFSDLAYTEPLYIKEFYSPNR